MKNYKEKKTRKAKLFMFLSIIVFLLGMLLCWAPLQLLLAKWHKGAWWGIFPSLIITWICVGLFAYIATLINDKWGEGDYL